MSSMEHVEFSKPRLALAVVTAPRQAFEEIINHNYLGTGIVITLLAGFVALIMRILSYSKGISSLYDLGVDNPLVTLSLVLAASLGVQVAAKAMGGQGTLAQTVTALGWAQVAHVFAFLFAIGALYSSRFELPAMLANLLFLVVNVIAVEQAHRLPIIKSILAYFFGNFFTIGIYILAFSFSRAINANISDLNTLAGSVPTGEPLYLAGVAIIAGIAAFMLLKELKWPANKRITLAVGALAGTMLFAGALGLVTKNVDPAGHLKAARAAYSSGDYIKADSELEKVLRVFPADFQAQYFLGQTYLMQGRLGPAEQQFKEILARPSTASAPMDVARLHTGAGAVRYAKGEYKAAVSDFNKAIGSWPNYREAFTRKALALVRLGDNKAAEKAADDALEAGADSAIPYVVLTQIYAVQGNEKKAKESFKMAVARNPEFAERIGRDPARWKTAVDSLTSKDLKYPIDTEPRQSVPARKQPPEKS